MQTATIIGSTGLIGGHLLNQLLQDDDIATVRALVRRSLKTSHPKLQVVVIDFSDLAAFKEGIRGSDAVFCAVGTTNKKVKGDKTAYRNVDYNIPVNAARCCAETDGKQFLLVSSVGADSHSRNFYLKLKGEVEEEIRRLPIPSVSIFRPSMLLGKRQESRPMESIAQAISKSLPFLFPSKYKPIAASNVARAMVAAGKQDLPGIQVHHFREMMALLK
ncbi:MAG: NAD(P)H-binding protein [Bacteroidales bacterium]|nr:NAD(P)H-binding protein [Bacteroidales bacterium]